MITIPARIIIADCNTALGARLKQHIFRRWHLLADAVP